MEWLVAVLFLVVVVGWFKAAFHYWVLLDRVNELEEERNEHVLQYNHKWVERLAQSAAQDCDHQRDRLNTLATALGYEWVPEGKTAARWRERSVIFNNDMIRSMTRQFASDFNPFPPVPPIPPASPKRRKGDRGRTPLGQSLGLKRKPRKPQGRVK